MRLSTGIKLALGVWFACETIVFILVAETIGVPETLLVAFITSLFGWTLLKRAGASAMVKLRATIEGRTPDGDPHRFLDETLATFGAVALLLPGFLSDIVGLVLAIPAARDRLSGWIGRGRVPGLRGRRGGRTSTPSTIDLPPEDWTRTEGQPGQPISKT